MPVEPPATPWLLPDPCTADPEGLVGVGADLEPGTVLAAYRAGLFPMPVRLTGPLGWWSPDPRGVLFPDELVVSRSLRRSCRRYRTSVDEAFGEVIRACASPDRTGRWISDEIIDAYSLLHELGWVHSVEVWDGDRLVGGLYGLSVGGLFAGESMFHRSTDASKVALVHLVELMRRRGGALIDVQWRTPHLQSLGAVQIPRTSYLGMIAEVTDLPVDPLGPPVSDDQESAIR